MIFSIRKLFLQFKTNRLIHTGIACYFERYVPKTETEFENFRNQSVQQPENARFLRVSIVGCPNAGKSTLLNQLIKWKVSAVSTKVHTTRKNVIGVLVEDNTQIEFFDTPGLINKKHMLKHKLEVSFINDLLRSVENSDVITILTDASNRRERLKLNGGILDLLKQYPDKESILVLNKVDKIKDKRGLLEVVSNLTCGIVGGEKISTIDDDSDLRRLELKKGKFESLFKKTEKYYCDYKDNDPIPIESKTGWPHFSQVFMISALNDDGVENLKQFYIKKAYSNPWQYDGKVVTKHNPKRLIIDAIREICLDSFNQEIPYNLRFQIVMWEIDEAENLYLVVDIFCPEKFLSLLIGPKGSTISNIVRKSRESISNIFRCDVSLKIAAKSFK